MPRMIDHCVALLHALGSNEFKYSDIKLSARLRTSLHHNSIDNGLLYYGINTVDPPRSVVSHDEELKYRILFTAHDTAMGGHFGVEKTYGMVCQTYSRRCIGI